MHNTTQVPNSLTFLISFALVCSSISLATEGSRPVNINPDHVRLARKLVDALDADNYWVRQKAAESLVKLGRAAIEPLEDGLKSESSEVRLRSTDLLIAMRGRGLLGIGMMIWNFDALPEFGAGVKTVPAGLPADQAGILTGDTILALDGHPVKDNNDLQRLVFVAGPARVMDVTIDRGGEKLHLPVLLTLNTNPPANRLIPPPVDLESELSESESKNRAVARENAMQTNFGQFAVVQGIVGQQNAPPPQPQPTHQPSINAQEIESEFERLRADIQKNEAGEK